MIHESMASFRRTDSKITGYWLETSLPGCTWLSIELLTTGKLASFRK